MREWDPRTAPSSEIDSLLDALNAVFAADLPDDPLWQVDFLREYLTETMPGERRLAWLATAGPAAPGRPVQVAGHVNVLLLGDIGVIDLLVHPNWRRQGVARELLNAAARRAWQEGIRSLGVEVVGATPAVSFYESLGFTREFTEIRSVLSLPAVDWAAIERMAAGPRPGYRIEFHVGRPPDELLDTYAALKAEARDPDDGDLDLRPSSYDAQRLRDSLDCLHRRGMQPYIVVAVEEATGTVVGLTEVVVPAQHPTRADQYDTIVRPDHRVHGIDRAIKARMLLELRSAEQKLSEVQTWNAHANEAIRKVNAELGFQPDREWYEYAVDVVELLERLAAG
ncbi:MAG TPA: GNAT family N-acetyltransferase [Micromonosporaceae bacterium]